MDHRIERGARALQVIEHGRAEALHVAPIEPGEPGPGEARVRVLASSATLSDSVVRRGMSPYLGHLEPPFVLGYDFAGIVEALGPGARGVEIGDLVVDVVRHGANADVVVRPAASLTRVPRGVDPIVAEAMAMTGVTALQLLTRLAQLAPGETVLVHGASGSVGLVAVGAARALGAAHVLGTASADNADLVAAQGGVPLDRRAPDLELRARTLSPRGFDVIVDAVGGGDVARLAALLAPRGRLVTFGLAGLARGGATRSEELVARVRGAFADGLAALQSINGAGDRRAMDYDVSTRRETHRAEYDADLAWLVAHVASGALRPVLVPRPLERAVEAHLDIDAGRVRGRIVFDHRL